MNEKRAVAPRRLPGLDAERLRALGLSRREIAVLELVARGSTNARTAEQLGISPLTVKKHLERMYAATAAPNRAALIALLSDGAGARAVPTKAKHDLPAPLTSFVGREREMDEVASLLTNTRLVTLGGPGGIGKTRLALEVASRIAARYADGVWLVELGDVGDPRLVLRAVSTALGVRESGRTRLGALIEELRPKELLIVLDNCEQVVHACAEVVGAVLRACPAVRVLATSREALGVSGEAFWHVPPLSLPDLVTASGAVLRAAAERSEAVRLFVERAALRRRGFALDADNARAIAHVCRSLDGMPLAIELAAARMSVLSVDEIASRLDGRSHELADPREPIARHRTLRGVVDWSYQLLARAEARLFERLCVFAGGCTLAAAEAVCAGGEVDARDVLDLIGRLVDKSFVIADTRTGATRYRTLETLHRYGRERLERSAALGAVARRHAAYFCALVEEAEPKLKGADQLAWYERLEAEHDNLRATLRWSLESDAELALRIAGAAWRFWDVRSHKEEGRRWLEAALVQEEGASPATRIKALNGAGNMAQARGDYPMAIAYHERSLALARESGDLPSIARSLSNLGDQALNVSEHERARVLHEEALRTYERIGDTWGVAISHIELGQVAYDLGDIETAARHYERGLELLRESKDEHRYAHSLVHVGKVARERGDLDRADSYLSQALRTFVAFADTWMVTIAVSQLACVDAARGRPAEAIPLLASAEGARRALDLRQAPHWGRDIERWTTAARDAVGVTAFRAAWAAGEAVPLGEAVSSVLGTTAAASAAERVPAD